MLNSVRESLTVGLALLLLGACGDQPAENTRSSVVDESSTATAISNVTVIDALNGVRRNQTVLFAGDEILAVQSADEPIEAGEVIDGEGKYLIPGLWDFHVHLTYNDQLIDVMPELFLSWGITSVRDTGGLMEEVLPVVRRMEAEGAMAPRVFFAGPLLDGRFVVYDGQGRPEIGVSVPTPQAARDMVRSMQERGVDFIKVYEMVSPEVFEALVAAANELGLPIDSHVPLAMRARVAGAAVDSIEHLRNIEMDCAADAEALHATRQQRLENPEGLSGAELRSSLHALQRIPAVTNYSEEECDQVIEALADTVMVPTLRLNSFLLAPPWQRAEWGEAVERLPGALARDWSRQADDRSQQAPGDATFAEWSLFLTGRMHEAGVPIGAGTDTPINLSIPGFSLHSELDMLVRAGLSPMEALAAATLIPARYFSLEDSMGSIEAGKVADLVLLDADPLADIGNSRRIARVISKGRTVHQN